MQLPKVNKSTLRKRALARRVKKLQQEGFTPRQIAELCGIDVARVKTLAELGERLNSLEDD